MAIRLSDHFTYKKLLRFCIAPVTMMLFMSVYGVVDGLFVSNFVGKVPFAAINLIMPFLMILGGFGFMVGTGGSALVAKTLGEGQRELANRYFSMMVKLVLTGGTALSLSLLLLLRPISALLGATDAMMSDCLTYGGIMLVFMPSFMLQNIFHAFLTTAEKPKLGLITTVAAGLTNIGLDALFIAGFRWGVAGAAVATGISQCVGGILPLIYFMRPNSSLLRLVRTRFEWPAVRKACANGASELMSSVSGSLVSMLYNRQLLRFAGENGVAAYGVLMYVQFIFIAVFIGYTVGTAPIVGFNYGARNHGELKNILKKSIFLTLLAGVVMMTVAKLLSSTLANIFVGYDSELAAMTEHAFLLFSYAFVLAGFNIFASSFFTALNNGVISAAISFLRTLVFQMLSVLILPIFFELEGIWWAITVAEVFAFMISIAFLVAKRKKYHYA